MINIHITILNWLVEFIAFFFVLLGSFILGHENSTVTNSLQCLSILFYFNILPCTFLVNKSDLKGLITESRWYISFLDIFGSADYQTDLQVEHLDRDDTVLKSYIFRSAWPTSVTEIALTSEAAAAIEEFDITWRYQHFEASGVNF